MFRLRPLISLLALSAMISMLVAACGDGSNDNPPAQRGNQISLVVHSLTRADNLYYQDENQVTYAVRNTDPDRTIAIAWMTVRNDRSDEVRLDVGPDAYRLLDEDANEYMPINPFEQRELEPNPPADEPFYLFFWGQFELQRRFGVSGAAIFDVPRDVKFEQLRWRAIEAVFVRFQGQFS